MDFRPPGNNVINSARKSGMTPPGQKYGSERCDCDLVTAVFFLRTTATFNLQTVNLQMA